MSEDEADDRLGRTLIESERRREEVILVRWSFAGGGAVLRVENEEVRFRS